MPRGSPHLAPLLAAMTRADFYPHRPRQIELRQTHISCVFLADQLVYKIKKPVRFPFVDYSTLCQRRHFCEEEVRLNRRLAPTTYIGVVAILKQDSGLVLSEDAAALESPAVVEFAVKMRRLSAALMLDRLVRVGGANSETIDAIVRRLVGFHRNAATDLAELYGAPEAIWQAHTDNLRETEPVIGEAIDEEQYAAIGNFCREFMASHRELFKARLVEGRVRDGHGDLRAEHICMTSGIDIFDCVEFSDWLRYSDVASELAFLAMDLDVLGAPALSDHLVRSYASLAEDPGLLELMPFYKCYRACVRGKVESLKAREDEIEERDRAQAMVNAGRYFSLADRYCKPPIPPSLIVVCGLVASGKSTLARALSGDTRFEILSSDITRKRLAGVAPGDTSASGYAAGIYTDSLSGLTYRTLAAEAEQRLRSGRGVIIDASCKASIYRKPFIELAARLHMPILFVECQATPEEIRRRMEQRRMQPDGPSDADWEVYLRQREEYAPPTEVPDGHLIKIDTSRPWERELKQLEKLLDQGTSAQVS